MKNLFIFLTRSILSALVSLLIAFAVTLVSTHAYAGNTSSSLEANSINCSAFCFDGVSLNCSFNQFTAQLEAKGYDLRGKEDGVALFSHKFAKNFKCELGACADENGNVDFVTMICPDAYSWKTLSKDYNAVKDYLTKMYGNPTECTEKFVLPGEFSDKDKMACVQIDACIYNAVFEVSGNQITVEIAHDDEASFVKVSYVNLTSPSSDLAYNE